jgi:hypothetical protein
MALKVLDIDKNWFRGTTVREINWDNINDPVLEWAEFMVKDVDQLRLDVFGSTYSFDNDGLANLPNPIYNPTTKTSSIDWIFSGSVTFSANNLNLYNGNDLVLYKDAGVTIGAKLDGGALTTTHVLDVPTADTLTTGSILNLISDSPETDTRSLVKIVNDNTLATGATPLEIIQDAAQRAVFIDQNADAVSISIDSEATTANVIDIASPATTSGSVLDITSPANTTGNIIDIPSADSLTTGGILNLISDSADTGTRTLVQITNDNALATGAVALGLQQDSTSDGLFIDQNGNGVALNIDSEATTANGLNLSLDTLTTGLGMYVLSDSADVSTRSLVRVTNDNTLATGTTPLEVIQDAAKTAVLLDQNADAISLTIDSEATTANIIDITGATTTTGRIIDITGADALTTGNMIRLLSDSASSSARQLLRIENDNTGSTGTIPLYIKQDAAWYGVQIEQIGDHTALRIDSSAPTSSVLNFGTTSTTTGYIIDVNTADSLTTGSIMRLHSSSTDASARDLVYIRNDSVAAIGSRCLTLRNDASGAALVVQNISGTDSFEVKEDGALLLPAIDPPEAGEATRNSNIKGWASVRWNGSTWVLDESYNVSSISSGSSSVVTVIWDTDFIGTTYPVTAGFSATGYTIDTGTGKATGSVLVTLSGAAGSGDFVFIQAAGSQTA